MAAQLSNENFIATAWLTGLWQRRIAVVIRYPAHHFYVRPWPPTGMFYNFNGTAISFTFQMFNISEKRLYRYFSNGLDMLAFIHHASGNTNKTDTGSSRNWPCLPAILILSIHYSAAIVLDGTQCRRFYALWNYCSKTTNFENERIIRNALFLCLAPSRCNLGNILK